MDMNKGVDWLAFSHRLQVRLNDWIMKHEGDRRQDGETNIDLMMGEWLDCVHKVATNIDGERR